MVRIIYKFDVEYPNYLLQAIVKDDKEEIEYKRPRWNTIPERRNIIE